MSFGFSISIAKGVKTGVNATFDASGLATETSVYMPYYETFYVPLLLSSTLIAFMSTFPIGVLGSIRLILILFVQVKGAFCHFIAVLAPCTLKALLSSTV